MNGTPTNWSPRRLPVLLLNAALVLPPALLYSVKTDTPVYVLITAAILLLAFFRKSYLPLGDRTVIYSVTAALILTIFPDMLIVIDDSRYGIFDLLVRSNLVIPLMTYLAAFSCAFYPYPARRGITAAGVISAMVLCGDRFNYMRLNNQLMPFLDPLLQHYALFYGIAAGWVILAVLLNFHYPGGIERKDGKTYYPFFRRTLLSFFLILVPLSAAALEKYYYSNDTLMRAVEYYIMRISFRHLGGRGPNRSRVMLSSRTDLNRSPLRDSSEKTVLFRAKAPRAPGYLRSGVYDFYRSGSWRTRRNPPQTVKLNAERRTGLVSYSTFSLPEKAPVKDGLKIELYFAALQSGGRIPVPGSTLELDAVADSGEITENGLFTLKQWKPDGGCTLRIPQNGLNGAWQGPADPEKEFAYLAVPRDLRMPLQEILEKFKPGNHDLDSVQSLREYFASYSYTLENVNTSHDRDPLLWFLERSRAGHCEFFASAAVLLLRSMGIPARYVTGFICGEKSPVADYYVVRGIHAHAWCEAYLRERKKWILVDLTPEEVLQAYGKAPENTRIQAWLDALKQLFGELFADIRRGHFAQAVMNMIGGIALLVWKLAGTIPGVLAGLAVLILLTVRYLRRSRKRTGKTGPFEMAASRRRLAGEFARFERRYAKGTGRRRPDNTALREFYQEPPASELCETYERLRYGKTEPSEDEIRDFTLRAARTVEIMRKSASRSRPD